ncbi:biotin/lipoate A/B protein ligase family protein [Natrialbaceae archaeon A-arb3/5]
MSEVTDESWRVIRDEPRNGATQMALEEIAAETALTEDLRTVRVYSWEPSTLSLGYRQNPETVDWEFCERAGIDVTRRQTGGGGIYHDRYADISYTIVAPAAEVPGDLMDCYALFCEPILDAFERMGVEADFAATEQSAIYNPSCYLRDINPAHDIVAPVSAGENAKKISGNAQYRQRDVVIQHGSLSFDLEPHRHVDVFAGEVEPETFTDRVTSIREQAGLDRETTVETVGNALRDWCDGEDGAWTAAELEAASELADRKYGADSWIRNRETLEAGQ